MNEAATQTPANHDGSIVAAQDVAVRFGKMTALVSASIEVAPGELVAVMGPSGSGQSTLLHCLAGLVAPRSGGVCFQGTDMNGLDDSERSELRLRRMGMVFQFGELRVVGKIKVRNAIKKRSQHRHQDHRRHLGSARWSCRPRKLGAKSSANCSPKRSWSFGQRRPNVPSRPTAASCWLTRPDAYSGGA